MKKIIIILLCVIIAAVGVFIFFQKQQKGPVIADALPGGAIAYVQFDEVENNLTQMASMPFWKAVRGINYDLLIEKNILKPQHKVFVDFVKTQLSQVLSNPMTKKLFGREIAFAVYPLNRDIERIVREFKVLNPQVIEELMSGVFLVTRIDPDVQFAEFLSRSFSKYGANVSLGQVEYEGQTIRTITIANAGVKFSYVRLKDMLIFGIGEKGIRTCIDVSNGEKTSLAQDPQFSKAQSTSDDSSSTMGYFDFEKLIGLMKGQMNNLTNLAPEGADIEAAQKQWEEVFSRMSGLKTFAFSSQMGPIIKFNNRLIMDLGKLDPEYAPLYTCPPQINKTIDFIPKDILGYHWNNCFALDYYWKEAKKEMARAGDEAPKVNELEEKIGFSIENDILPTFGDEVGGYLSDIQTGGLFPIPKFVFFIEIKRKDKAENLLARVKEQPMLMLQEENYNGVAIKYLALPLGSDLQPGYCFLNNYLLIASSRQLLHDSIDTAGNSSTSLVGNPAFKEINFGLTDKNRSVQFIKIGAIIEKIKNIMEWSNDWVTAQNQKAEAFKAGSKKPLEEVKEGIMAKTEEIQTMRDHIVSLEDQVWNLETKGEDVTAIEAQINDLKNQIEAKEVEIAGDRERQQELENILQESAQNVPDPALRQTVLDEVVFPVLESLKSIQTYGSHVTFEKDSIETSVFLKVSE